MTAQSIDASQRRAAIVVGIVYLIAMALSMLTEGYLRPQFVVADDAVATAQNIVNRPLLFRVSIVADLLMFGLDVSLIAALYVVLAPVNRHLAQYAALLRMAAVSMGVVMAADGFEVLRILGGTEYLKVFQADQLAALARVGIANHGSQYNVVFVFLGLGSIVFGYLWWKSGYVPKGLGILGMVASFLLAAGTVTLFLAPSLRGVLYPAYMVPMFFFEVGIGFWLLVKGLPKA